MPQKRNPFLLEHVIGRSASPLGAFVSAVTAMHSSHLSNSVAVGSEGVRGLWSSIGDACDTLVSAHPNAGLLFVEFMTSKDGQQIFQKANYLPARADVAPLTPELVPERGGFAATVLTPAITDKAIDRWDDIFKQLFR